MGDKERGDKVMGGKEMGDKERGQCNFGLQITILEEAKS
jgi:hypothetical protein